MTYNEWEKELLLHLNGCSDKDRDAAVNYYKEMYGDKSEAGLSDEEIIETFGSAALAAEKIIMEAIVAAPDESDTREEKKKGISISKIIGWFFLTTLVLIPLAATVISVIATFGAVAASGAAMVIAGVLGALASPFILIFGNTGLGILASFGTSLACAGIGILLFISFYYITKYAIVTTVKITKHVLKRELRK